MYTAFVIAIMILSVFLILAVLIQNPKGGGLTSQFTGAGSTQLFGVKQTGDLLEQITWGIAGTIGALVLATIFFIEQPGSADAINSINVEKAQTKSLPAPMTPAPTTTPAPQQQPVVPAPVPAPQR
ncbi:MAG: preprotein translocase subunit SecG [Cytophagaceae bacterium]|nr:preprotein translocase subunit SecG [Cytophagaceae bacterium]